MTRTKNWVEVSAGFLDKTTEQRETLMAIVKKKLSWSGLLSIRVLRWSVNEQHFHKEYVPNVYHGNLALAQYGKLTLREQVHRDTLPLSERALCAWDWCYTKLAREGFRNMHA